MILAKEQAMFFHVVMVLITKLNETSIAEL